MLRKFLQLLSALLAISVCTFAQNQEWKQIDSEYYSFSIPDEWIPYTSDSDGVTLSKRTVGDFVISVLAWKNNAQVFEEYENVQIQSVEKNSGENITLKEGRDLIYDRKKPRTKTYFKSENEICFKSVYESGDMFGNVVSWTTIYYYKYDGKRYHKMHCGAQTKRFKTEKDLEERYLRIIKSFQLKMK